MQRGMTGTYGYHLSVRRADIGFQRFFKLSYIAAHPEPS